MKRSYLFLGSILIIAGGSVMHCSGGDDSDAGGGDAAPDGTKPKDAATEKVIPPDELPPVVTPAGTQLAASNQIQIFGITTDGYVIYADNSAGASLYAVSVSGGAPTLIASPTISSTKTYITGIAGKDVFVWEGVSSTANAAQVGALSVWTHGGTYKSVVASSCASAGFASTTDGAHIMFTGNSTASCTTGDVVVANIDATGQTNLVTGVDVGVNGCSPVLGFAGGVTAVTATCTATPPDGGTPVADVNAYGSATPWTKVSITTGALNFWASDTAGDKLMVASPTGESFTLSLAVPVLVPIDNTKNITNGGFGYMKKSGNAVFYTTAAGEMYESPVPTPVPVQLQSAGVKSVRSISPDDNYIIFTTNFDTQKFGGDLFLAKTTAAGAPVTLVNNTMGALFGVNPVDDFSGDSNYVLWIENLDATHGIGDLYAQTVVSGTPKKITTSEWQNLSAAGSKIVFNDNCQNCSGTSAASGGTADIKSVDLAGTAAPSVLQLSADVTIFLSPAKDKVIYTYSQNAAADDGGVSPSGNGLYAVTIP